MKLSDVKSSRANLCNSCATCALESVESIEEAHATQVAQVFSRSPIGYGLPAESPCTNDSSPCDPVHRAQQTRKGTYR